jgi:hypothetical protein
MANTQTTVPAFVASQVLTAEEMTQSASTGVPVFATTVTRDAGFGGSGQKALAQGQLCYLEATDVVQYYDGSAWATLAPAPAAAAGLTFIAGGSISDTTSVDSCFSATYLNYKVVFSNLTSGDGSNLNLRMRTSGTDNTSSVYSSIVSGSAVGGAYTNGLASQNGSTFALTYGNNYANGQTIAFDMFSPFEAKNTQYGIGNAVNGQDAFFWFIAGIHKSTTSFDGFTIYPATSTLTGTYKIYGYANS